MSIFQFLILIMLTICVFFIQNSNDEYFDEKVTDASRKQCGILCTKIIGCKGFSYDEKNKNCYLSKTQILGKPFESKYVMEYNRSYPKCNKPYPITDDVIATYDDLQKNAQYVCTDSNDFLIYKNVDKYKLESIEWNNEISVENPENNLLFEDPTLDNSIVMMKLNNNEYLGKYVYPHKCSTHIKLEDCLKDCAYNDKCVGTEWNKQVCCPKMRIDKIINRREKNKDGFFFTKERIIKNNLTNNDVIVKLN